MPTIFDALPGMEVPVDGITRGFAKLWENTDEMDQKAMQLNLVVHFGFATTEQDAVEQFRVAGRLGERYPCRVVILCPLGDDTTEKEMRAKIYGECFTGKSKGDTRCIEIVALSYPPSAKAYLQDQVSICLSTDLPVYFWAHRFTSSQRMGTYQYLLTRSQRVMFDSAIVSADALSYAWPNISAVRDLAYTRTLPLRQNIGQFLSRYAPALIIEGLQEVTIHHRAQLAGEAGCLLGWVKKGLVRSGANVDQGIKFIVTPVDCAGCFSLRFIYSDKKKHFEWSADLTKNNAEFTGDLGTGKSTQTVSAHFMTPEAALAEAMFF
ncbi:MAG: glucose-6-phosphate dehydrogenase assembly protein OpcA [Lacunisphaera sp.]